VNDTWSSAFTDLFLALPSIVLTYFLEHTFSEALSIQSECLREEYDTHLAAFVHGYLGRENNGRYNIVIANTKVQRSRRCDGGIVSLRYATSFFSGQNIGPHSCCSAPLCGARRCQTDAS
jgi:hypothetical protein